MVGDLATPRRSPIGRQVNASRIPASGDPVTLSSLSTPAIRGVMCWVWHLYRNRDPVVPSALGRNDVAGVARCVMDLLFGGDDASRGAWSSLVPGLRANLGTLRWLSGFAPVSAIEPMGRRDAMHRTQPPFQLRVVGLDRVRVPLNGVPAAATARHGLAGRLARSVALTRGRHLRHARYRLHSPRCQPYTAGSWPTEASWFRWRQ